ncbi:MAG: enoyl-CoA hydratase/isomerase family protein [Candidatus Dormibacteraceae bacterium]
MPDAPTLDEVLVSASGAIATVTLNRPGQRNPLGPGMLRDLIAAFSWCRDQEEVRAVVLTGAGEKAFSAGADLSSFGGSDSDLDRHRGRHAFVRLFQLMRGLGKPIVARVNGHALAGGFGLACSCDLLVAADHATFGTPEVNVGVWPMMIQAVLRRDIPRKVLLEMVMLGDRWSASQMREWGLVNRVVPAAGLDAATGALAARLAEKPAAVMRLGRDAFYRQEDLAFDAALDYLVSQLALVTLTEDSKEGIQAFLEKRPPDWKGL